jgi:hypothetical protein
MPLAKSGRDILKAFMQEYGAKTGKSIFYAKENKSAKFARLVKHGKKRRRKS